MVILSSAITGGEGDLPVGAAAIYDTIEQTVAYAEGVIAVPRSEMLSTGLDERVRECGANVDCVGDELRAAQIDRALFAIVNLRTTPSLIAFRVLEASSKRELASSTSHCERGCDLEAILRRDAGAILEKVGHRMRGRLSVETVPPNAQVSIEPNAGVQLLRAGVYAMPAGPYAITAGLEDFADTSTRAIVARQKETQLYLKLEPEPGVAESPWLWLGIGATVAAGAAIALAVALREPGRFLCVEVNEHSACEDKF